MSNNPFKPPETDSSKSPRPPVPPGSPLKAVLMGLATDIGGSAVVSLVISVIYATQLHGQGLSDSEIRDALEHPPHDSALFVAGILLGALMSVLGGYVCARIVRRDEYRAGLVMAAASAVFSLMMGGADGIDDMAMLLMLTGAACNLLGVKYGAEHNHRAQGPAGPGRDTSTP